jgi:hypothetical protein
VERALALAPIARPLERELLSRAATARVSVRWAVLTGDSTSIALAFAHGACE